MVLDQYYQKCSFTAKSYTRFFIRTFFNVENYTFFGRIIIPFPFQKRLKFHLKIRQKFSLNLKLHNRYCHSQQLGQFNSVESLQILGPCCWEIRKGNQKKLLMPGSRFHRIGFSFFIKKRICPRKRKLIYKHIISHL